MPFKIVRGDAAKMNTEAMVKVVAGRLLVDFGGREEVPVDAIGGREEIPVDAVGGGEEVPVDTIGGDDSEGNLRACYRKSLELAEKKQVKSVTIPLLTLGDSAYPREEGTRIAAEETLPFLTRSEMLVCLSVPEETQPGHARHPGLDAYIDSHYREASGPDAKVDGHFRETSGAEPASVYPVAAAMHAMPQIKPAAPKAKRPRAGLFRKADHPTEAVLPESLCKADHPTETALPKPLCGAYPPEELFEESIGDFDEEAFDIEEHEGELAERMSHMSDTFSEYLLYLIQEKGMENADVYKRAIVDKKTFSKIKNHPAYHPQKITALCLCVGARLNLDETRDLLARAGYALSPCDKTDIIFSYFIENGIYDMIEIDIQLEEHGVPCIIA